MQVAQSVLCGDSPRGARSRLPHPTSACVRLTWLPCLVASLPAIGCVVTLVSPRTQALSRPSSAPPVTPASHGPLASRPALARLVCAYPGRLFLLLLHLQPLPLCGPRQHFIRCSQTLLGSFLYKFVLVIKYTSLGISLYPVSNHPSPKSSLGKPEGHRVGLVPAASLEPEVSPAELARRRPPPSLQPAPALLTAAKGIARCPLLGLGASVLSCVFLLFQSKLSVDRQLALVVDTVEYTQSLRLSVGPWNVTP